MAMTPEQKKIRDTQTRKARASKRKFAVKKADTYFSLYIRARDGRCVCCGAVTNLQCGHLFTRSYFTIRWDPMNAFCQCAGCNLSHEHDPGPLTRHFLRIYDAEAYEALHKKGRATRKFNTEQLNQIADEFRQRSEALKNDRHKPDQHDRKPDEGQRIDLYPEWLPGFEIFDSE